MENVQLAILHLTELRIQAIIAIVIWGTWIQELAFAKAATR
jgi:hypothetical protein